MKRIALVFFAAILVPSLLLAWLAIRSVRDQEVILNNQKALLHQATCDTVAADINLFLDDVRVFYGQVVDRLVDEEGERVVSDFPARLVSEWSQALVGAVVSEAGGVISPSATGRAAEQAFLLNHGEFLGNRRVVEVYQAPAVMNRQLQVIEEAAPEELESAEALMVGDAPPKNEGAAQSESSSSSLFSKLKKSREQSESIPEPSSKSEKRNWKVGISQNRTREFRFENAPQQAADSERADAFDAAPVAFDSVASEAARKKEMPASAAPPGSEVMDPFAQQDVAMKKAPDNQRTVAPSQNLAYSQQLALPTVQGDQGFVQSRLNVESVLVNDLAASQDEGAVGRIIDGDLHVLLWKRHEAMPDVTFWAELDLEEIQRDLAALFDPKVLPGTDEVCLALLNSRGEPVAKTAPGFAAEWSRPFVAAEVGQILPRWEIAVYLLDPNLLGESARTVRLTLWLFVLILLAAVGVGSLLILKAVNLEMRIASQKTDFVSNVSHELKTPLTSIRMFSELLAGSEQHDADKTRNYSRVISKESARLTRLINRLLDFSRLDRGEMKLEMARVDIAQLVEETVECYRLQIEAEGLDVEVRKGPSGSWNVEGDRDALSQVLLNLLSNAEKYAAEGGEIVVEVKSGDGEMAEILVHDRGKGISRSHQRRIFDRFYRVDESIDSGIDGSGIGLALCRQIVEKHGGTIAYRRREGGGSSFVVSLPLDTAS